MPSSAEAGAIQTGPHVLVDADACPIKDEIYRAAFALFDESAGRMDVQGWATFTNNSGTPYTNADVLRLAGQPDGGGGYNPGRGGICHAGTET